MRPCPTYNSSRVRPRLIVVPTDMALSRGAAPVGLQASTARGAAEGGGPPEAVVDWDVASRARRMQRLVGQVQGWRWHG